MKEFIKYRKALDYAIEKYGDLKRKVTHLPYVIHPLRISAILRAAGFNEFDHQDMMIATLFHDLVEDTDITLEDITNGFGAKIAALVGDLTHPTDMPGEKKDDWLRTFANVSTEVKIDQLKHSSYKAEYDIVSIPRLLGSITLPGYAQFADGKYIKGIGFTLAALGSVALMISKYTKYSSAEDAYKTALHNYDFAFDENTAIRARNEAERKQVEYQTSKENFEISLAVVAIVWVGNAIDVALNHFLSDRINAFAYTAPLNTKESTSSNYWLSLNYKIE